MPNPGGLEKKQRQKKAENEARLCLICRVHPRRRPHRQDPAKRAQRLRGLQDGANAGVVSGLGKIAKETEAER
jgi:hypothetical protein